MKKIPAAVADKGRVHMGGMAPSLPPVRKPSKQVGDAGKVRMGGMSPSL